MSDAPIRQFFEEWHRATIAEDTARLLDLMAEDVVFLSPGQPPMQGRDAFAKAFTDALHDITINGHMACCWAELTVTLTPRAGGPPRVRKGHNLTVLRQRTSGEWVLLRDANLLT
jgi:ketosteroid isomerase-like protein